MTCAVALTCGSSSLFELLLRFAWHCRGELRHLGAVFNHCYICWLLDWNWPRIRRIDSLGCPPSRCCSHALASCCSGCGPSCCSSSAAFLLQRSPSCPCLRFGPCLSSPVGLVFQNRLGLWLAFRFCLISEFRVRLGDCFTYVDFHYLLLIISHLMTFRTPSRPQRMRWCWSGRVLLLEHLARGRTAASSSIRF